MEKLNRQRFKIYNDKSEILNIYIDRKTAAVCNHYKSTSALDIPVKNEKITDGHYYMLYSKCTEEIKDNYVQKYGEPLLYKDGVGKFNDEFICKYDCIKQLKMSDKTLAKILCIMVIILRGLVVKLNIMKSNYYTLEDL